VAKPVVCALGFLTTCLLLWSGIAYGQSVENRAVIRAPCSNGPAVRSVGLAAFWTAFRSAVLADEYDHVAALVKFPLLSSGIVDTDETKRIERTKFASFFKSFLSSPSGEGRADESVHDFIGLHACVTDQALNRTRDSAQIGGMVFDRSGSVWQLTRTFSESD
jgi:hypothetical protein